MLTREKAFELLMENNCPENVVKHAEAVSKKAREIAEKLRLKGVTVDIDFVENAALIHDIGRCQSHGIDHGLKGAQILRDYPRYARISQTHIGGGITKKEARQLGLPEKDFLPQTLEEKIVCLADKLTTNDRYITIEKSIERFQQKLGSEHPTIKRIKKINNEINSLLK